MSQKATNENETVGRPKRKFTNEINIEEDNGKSAANKKKMTQKEKRLKKLERDRLYQAKRKFNETAELRQKRLQQNRSCQYEKRETMSYPQHRHRLTKLGCNRNNRNENNAYLSLNIIPSDEHNKTNMEKIPSQPLLLSQNLESNEIEDNQFWTTQRLKKLNADCKIFEKTVNTFCDKICDICTKTCYPNQVVNYPCKEVRSYLPDELKEKTSLLLCYRCKSHLQRNKNHAPSKAYWNSLDPGPQPDIIKQLTQPEQRLLSRMIPFIKIVKFNGQFGQFGFNGQAILFAQDIFEVSDKLPTMLPRSSSDSGIVVVTEHLENLNINRQFSISRPKVYNALKWLIQNNPLYRDVSIDYEAQIDDRDLIRIVDPSENINVEKENEKSYFKQINEVTRIMRASWNQSNKDVFDEEFAGFQGCTMVLVNLLRASIKPIEKWTHNTLDMNMIEGDRIYKKIIDLLNNNHVLSSIDSNKLLEIRNFDLMNKDFKIFESEFSIEYNSDTDIFGNLQDRINKKIGFGINLEEAIIILFHKHDAGILITAEEAFGLIHQNSKYYFTDSHSCGEKGARARSNNGKACIIECETIAQVQKICRRAVGSKNQEYSLTYIDVHLITRNCVFEMIVEQEDDTLVNNEIYTDRNNLIKNNKDHEKSNVQSNYDSHYFEINDVSRIVRATYNQNNEEVFASGYAGVQCCAMVLANIVRAYILPPYKWTTQVLDENMIEGDGIYSNIRLITENNPEAYIIYEDGYLEIKNFNVIKEDFIMYNTCYYIEYDENTELFGSLDDKQNNNNGTIGITLIDGLRELFLIYQAGVLIASGKSLGVMYYNEKYYFTDSHSCGPRGARATTALGRACIIECDTIEELCRLCKRSTGSHNINYTLNYIVVRIKNDAVVNEIDNRREDVIYENNNFEAAENGLIIDDERQEIQENFNYDYDVRLEDVNYNSETTNFDQQREIPIQTYVMAPNDCRQPDVEEELEISEEANKICRKTKDNIVNVDHELKAEEYGWFYLFPNGINGLKEKSRQVKISPLDYFQFRILGKDKRFQRNDYLFYALSMYENERVKTTISACGKKIHGENGMVDDVHLYLKSLRGSAAYWRTALNELIALIRCIGPPHYFITFSCNDLHWWDMKKALLIADGRPDTDPDDVSISETQCLIEKYPVIVSRHFMVRVNALMRLLKNNKDIFGGELIDFWWRIEFQNRGSPHLHMVVWIDSHPSFETVEGIKRIDEICSCKFPEENSELYELVKKCQTHNHTSTCKKNNTYCRFSFPRQECPKTKLVAHSSDDFIRSGGRICLLKRRKEDKWINNYNPILLKLWKGNMDIQPCGSNEAIAFYIAKYVSKAEPTGINPGIAQAIRRIQREESDVSRKMFKICMRVLQERQVSACESAFRLCHLNFRSSSRKCVFLNTRKPEQRYKVLRFDEKGEANGYCANIFERYEKRPYEHNEYDFENMCLLEFAMKFEPKYNKNNIHDNDEPVDQYESENPRVRLRTISLIDNSEMLVRNRPSSVRVPYFKATDDPENFYYSMLVQYLPYRNENELIGEYNSAKEAFLNREERIKEMNNIMQIFRNRDQQLENALNQVHAFEILNQQEFVQEENDIEEELPERQMDDAQFQQAQRAMNLGQREIFKLVTESVRNQLVNGSMDRLRLFITGNAGTGKSFTLHLLKNQVNRCFGKNVTKICALTGVAARLIRGSTLHSTLKLPVQKDGRILQMPLLTGMYLRQMRLQWKDTEFFFIDEISMVPYEMLCMIDSRLKQLKNCDEFFGGLHIIVLGDLMQLPPVRGNQVFRQPYHLAPATDLWRLFSLIELKENMRQQGSTILIEILNALRVGELRAEHISELLERTNIPEVGEFSIEKALRIYPTNEQVNNHNLKVLNYFKNKGTQMNIIVAQDQLIDSTRNVERINLNDIVPSDVNKTGGMPKELTIFVGAKVMLRSNIDVSKGLVNGAIGFITEIKWPYFRRAQIHENDIPSVNIDFGNDGVHLIEPKSVQFPAKFSYGTIERRMLPLILSWATTVHKMQGSTVDFATVYLGPKIFAEGQAYVALSRVRSLEGIRIEELDSTKITGKKPCNNEALIEMERMRRCDQRH